MTKTKIVIDSVGGTLQCTAEQAAQITKLGAELDAALRALTAESDPLGPLHSAYRVANRAYTAALADAGDPMANLL